MNDTHLAWFVVIAIYFAPVITAFQRKHINTTAIFVLNLFLGWTVIGWVIALVWSYTHQSERRTT